MVVQTQDATSGKVASISQQLVLNPINGRQFAVPEAPVPSGSDIKGQLQHTDMYNDSCSCSEVTEGDPKTSMTISTCAILVFPSEETTEFIEEGSEGGIDATEKAARERVTPGRPPRLSAMSERRSGRSRHVMFTRCRPGAISC